MRIMMLLSIVMIISCETFGPKKTRSEWSTLKSAESVDCERWPMHRQDLGVDWIQVLSGKHQTGFVVKGRLRKGIPAYYVAEFEGEAEIPSSKAKKRAFGSNAIVAGGGVVDNKLHLVLIQNNGRKGSKIELRTMSDNVVRYNVSGLISTMLAGESTFVKEGFWLQYKRGGSEQSIDTLPTKILFAKKPTKDGESKMKAVGFAGVQYPTDPTVLPIKGEEKALVLWHEDSTFAKNRKPGFRIRELTQTGKFSKVSMVDVPIKSGVESWGAIHFKDFFLLAYVDGDSLVGQANLRVLKFEWTTAGAVVKWMKTKSLINEHVSEPEWVATDVSTYLMLPKWVDEESTIATYRVGTDGIHSSRALGIFPKGSRVMGAFADVKESQLYGLIRSRPGLRRYGWDYKICRMDDL